MIEDKLLEIIEREHFVEILVETYHFLTLDQLGVLSQYGQIRYVSRHLPYIGMYVPSENVREINKLPFVKKIWHVPVVEIQIIEEGEQLGEVTLKDSKHHIGGDVLNDRGCTGKNIKVAIIDTGVDKEHPMLKDKVVAEKSFAYTWYGEHEPPEDNNGHGTWCASCACGRYWTYEDLELEGMAPDALIINARALNREGRSTPDLCMAAMEWSCEQGAHILSCSWGWLCPYGPYEPLERLIRELINTYNVIVVAAAGNYGPLPATIFYPAGYREVIGVGAIAVRYPEPDIIARFSSRGPNDYGDTKPDVCAPGGSEEECIWGAFPGEEVRCARGTSMATPHISGGLAAMLECNLEKERIFYAVRKKGTRGKDNTYGYGITEFNVVPDLKPLEIVFKSWRDMETGWPMGTKPRLKRYIWKDSAFYVEADVAEPPRVLLRIRSDPSGIPFRMNGFKKRTPFEAYYVPNTVLTIRFPSGIRMGGIKSRRFVFNKWEDGSVDRERTITIKEDTTLKAIYNDFYYRECLFPRLAYDTPTPRIDKGILLIRINCLARYLEERETYLP